MYVDENEMYRYGTAFPFIYIKRNEERIIIEKHQLLLLLFNIDVYKKLL